MLAVTTGIIHVGEFISIKINVEAINGLMFNFTILEKNLVLLFFPFLSVGLAHVLALGMKKATWLCAMPQVLQLGVGVLAFVGVYAISLKTAYSLNRGR